MDAHPFIQRQHKLDSMSYVLKRENIIGNLEGVRDRDVKLLLTQLKVYPCCISFSCVSLPLMFGLAFYYKCNMICDKIH